MNEIKEWVNDLKVYGKCKEFAQPTRKIFMESADIIESLCEKLKTDGWIPCSERLPEIEQTVLLSLRSLDVSVGFRANTDGYFYTEGEGYVLYENVLAWQPLPEAYHE